MDNNFNNWENQGQQEGQTVNVNNYQQQGYGAPQQSPYGTQQQSPYGNAQQQQSPYGNVQQPQQQMPPYGTPQQQQSPYGTQGQPTPPPKKTNLIIIGVAVGLVVVVAAVFAIKIIGQRYYDGRHQIDPYTEEPYTYEITEEPYTDEYTTEEFTTEEYTTEELTTEQTSSEDPFVMPDDILNGTGEVVIKEFTDDTFKLNSWLEKHDGSYLVPNLDGSFVYYKDKYDTDNNFVNGHYDLYTGQKALDYITQDPDMIKYGVTEEEMMGVFERNDYYDLKNFVVLILHNEECYEDGENTMESPVDTPYFGFYMVGETEEGLDIANMNTQNYYWFKLD